MLLDLHNLEVHSPHQDLSGDDWFYLAMNEYNDPFAVYFTHTQLRVGGMNAIKMTPLIAEASEDLRHVPIKKRSCRFSDELDGMKMFQNYSQAKCEYECMMKYALEKCAPCIPWNMPQVSLLLLNQTDKFIPFCDHFQNRCFFKVALGNSTHKAMHCKCLPSCNSVSIGKAT